MRQVWITRRGGPEVLKVRDAPDPEPQPGEVRVRVAAAGINFADILARMGLYPDAPPLPAVVGFEVAGTVDRVGAGVSALNEGTRAVVLTKFGGYGDVVTVPARQVLALPDSVTFEQAAAIPVNYLTAWLMLVHLGNVQAGDRVLVHAAAGGVGLAALQIARRRGAEVIGTASASKHERLRALGVAHAIDYRSRDFEAEVRRITDGRGVEIALDAVGGASFRKSYRSLARMGRLFVFGVSSAAPSKRRRPLSVLAMFLRTPRFHPLALMKGNRGVIGFYLGDLWHRADRIVPMLEEIVRLVADGALAPVVDRAFPFERAGEAHAYIQDRKNFGKVLLVP